ncbi:MAG: 2-oxoacid:acceptor oxidoreductase subunit alpha [Candidatus Moranbacteria bacterium]|nr:2-oxoacid:acceptor oxidoreductase subunit alpha [Candidatus Moranbacteria bacterium]
MNKTFKEDFTIVVAGQAGQGIQTVAKILSHILKLSGYHVFVTQEYMSRVRGGINSTTIRVSNQRRNAQLSKVDLFISLDSTACHHCQQRFSSETLFLGEKNLTNEKQEFLQINFNEIANRVGNRLFANTVAIGSILGLMGVNESTAKNYVKDYFSKKGKDIVDNNLEAFQIGYKNGNHLAFSNDINFEFKENQEVKDDVFLSGAEIIGLGALAGGCNFCSSYPMSPSTNVLNFLAKHGKENGVIVDQAMDEIEAVNMVLGVWYAGGRGLVNTAGGGFALMCETISLAGMIEMPLVVHVAGRPGPATGLPTRTAQEDLNLVLYAGHGEFMRAIFAPGTAMQGYELMVKAFDVADNFQVPVFVLTDQHFIDSLFCIERKDFAVRLSDNNIVKTEENYKRYELTESGISKRGVPGWGEGLVCVDGDEHDEDGRITEDMQFLRKEMMDKRFFKRKELLEEVALVPTTENFKESEKVIVCWGSNFNVVKEAIERSGRDDLGFVHFSQLFPFHKKTKEMFSRDREFVMVENNASGQMADLIEKELKVRIEKRILKFNGEPFCVEELVEGFLEL